MGRAVARDDEVYPVEAWIGHVTSGEIEFDSGVRWADVDTRGSVSSVADFTVTSGALIFGVSDGIVGLTIESVTLVPEPGTALLLALGLAGLARRPTVR